MRSQFFTRQLLTLWWPSSLGTKRKRKGPLRRVTFICIRQFRATQEFCHNWSFCYTFIFLMCPAAWALRPLLLNAWTWMGCSIFAAPSFSCQLCCTCWSLVVFKCIGDIKLVQEELHLAGIVDEIGFPTTLHRKSDKYLHQFLMISTTLIVRAVTL